MFAFRSCLIIRLYSDLTVRDAFGILGGFCLGVYIGWEDTVYLTRELGVELVTSDELDA